MFARRARTPRLPRTAAAALAASAALLLRLLLCDQLSHQRAVGDHDPRFAHHIRGCGRSAKAGCRGWRAVLFGIVEDAGEELLVSDVGTGMRGLVFTAGAGV